MSRCTWMWTAVPSADSGLSPIASSRGLSAGPLPGFHGGGVFCTPGRLANEPNAGPSWTPPPLLVELVVLILGSDEVELDPPPLPLLPQPASSTIVARVANSRMSWEGNRHDLPPDHARRPRMRVVSDRRRARGGGRRHRPEVRDRRVPRAGPLHGRAHRARARDPQPRRPSVRPRPPRRGDRGDDPRPPPQRPGFRARAVRRRLGAAARLG